MDFTVFQYLNEIPDVITPSDWYRLALLGYNMGLTFFWFFIADSLIDKLFKCFNKAYRKGSD